MCTAISSRCMNHEAASDAKISDCNVLQGIIPAFFF
jgi:hypothetical protein